MPDGQMGSAWYGKICHASQRFAGASRLRLDYYLHPDGTWRVERHPMRHFDRDFADKLTNKSSRKP
jgi:hypothetical protein